VKAKGKRQLVANNNDINLYIKSYLRTVLKVKIQMRNTAVKMVLDLSNFRENASRKSNLSETNHFALIIKIISGGG
jgi:hypothetical protein